MGGMLLGDRPTVRGVWTPTPDEQLADELQAALARPRASHVTPPRPVALATEENVVGRLWGRMQTVDGTWLGLATGTSALGTPHVLARPGIVRAGGVIGRFGLTQCGP